MTEPNFPSARFRISVLLISVFIIAICGILYELLISTITSYFQGSSILHFSIVIGLFLSFMGVGSYCSRFIQKHLLVRFIQFEIALGLIGGFAAFILYFAFSLTPYFYIIAFALIAILGALIGIEIPILTRIVRRYESLKDAMAKVLSFDYLGALFASVAFPLLLLPFFGTMKTSFLIGLLNLAVACFNIWLFRSELENWMQMMLVTLGLTLSLIGGFAYSFQLVSFFEERLYQDEIMLVKQSPYQHIVVTRWNQDLRLFINGNLQFSSRDEYRYHESLVHVPMALSPIHEKILILGGGDGLAVREILKYKDVERIDLVDLDPMITRLGKSHPVFTKINENALQDTSVHIYNEDAYKFVEHSSDIYNVIIIDLPDPNDASLGKLYSKEFYELLKKRVAAGSVVVTQSTSPYYAPKAFWCIHHTLEAVFPHTIAYNLNVPTFGPWGFNLAFAPHPQQKDSFRYASHTRDSILQKRLFHSADSLNFRYLNPETTRELFLFDQDKAEVKTDTNRLENQILIKYYENSWSSWR